MPVWVGYTIVLQGRHTKKDTTASKLSSREAQGITGNTHIVRKCEICFDAYETAQELRAQRRATRGANCVSASHQSTDEIAH